jgi:hypothetical protein
MTHLHSLLSILFALLFSMVLRAQVIVPTAETAFEDHHNFNPSFIKSKGIRKITYEIIDKKDFQVAVDNSLTETYEFNPEGLLTRHYYTIIARVLERHVATVSRRGKVVMRNTSEFEYDTVGTTYTYDNGKLALKRSHDGRSYYEGRYYRYDTTGNLTKELRYKETNNSANRSFFILGSQTLMSEDSFSYTRFPSGQLKCLYLNNENRPYKERIINYEDGRVKHIFESYTAASWIVQEYKFSYSGGKLAAASFEGNASTPVRLVNQYEYDDAGELYGEKHFRDSVLVKEVSYVTDKVNGLLNSFVIRDHLQKTMRIVKLRYDLGLVGRSEGRRF